MFKKLLVLMLMGASGSLFTMQPQLADLREYPLTKVDSALRIQVREALRRNDFETASSLMERLLARNMHPGKEVMAELQNKDLGIPLALVAAQKDDDRTIKFLIAEGLIDPMKLQKKFKKLVDRYVNEEVVRGIDYIAMAEHKLRAYLALAAKIHNQYVLDINMLDAREAPLLMRAVQKQRKGFVAFLIAQGALVNLESPSRSKRTPLHEATEILGYPGPLDSATGNITEPSAEARANAIQIIRMLLEAGANPNAQNSAGETPLMNLAYGLASVSPEAIKLLLRHGANPCIKEIDGHTILHYLKAREKIYIPNNERAEKEAKEEAIQIIQNAMTKKCPEPMDTSD